MLELLQHPLIPLLTFAVGLLVGHRTALWRDRRKEFNDAAEPIRAWLLRERGKPSFTGDIPGLVAIDRLVLRLHWWQRKGFLGAWQRQQDARKAATRKNLTGAPFFEDTDALLAALAECLGYTVPR